jgi:hypothetical protein
LENLCASISSIPSSIFCKGLRTIVRDAEKMRFFFVLSKRSSDARSFRRSSPWPSPRRHQGRSAAITGLVEAVGRQSFTALVGASGSGKSSVVLAGLAPRLDGDRAGNWRFSHFRIGTELESNPFLPLARALAPLYVASDSDVERLRNTKLLATSPAAGELTLRDVFAVRLRHPGGANNIQGFLFPMLREEVGPLTAQHERLLARASALACALPPRRGLQSMIGTCPSARLLSRISCAS